MFEAFEDKFFRIFSADNFYEGKIYLEYIQYEQYTQAKYLPNGNGSQPGDDEPTAPSLLPD